MSCWTHSWIDDSPSCPLAWIHRPEVCGHPLSNNRLISQDWDGAAVLDSWFQPVNSKEGMLMKCYIYMWTKTSKILICFASKEVVVFERDHCSVELLVFCFIFFSRCMSSYIWWKSNQIKEKVSQLRSKEQLCN